KEQCIQLIIEIGHRSSPKTNPTKEGFTHDWTVYVRGYEGCDISQFVEKVVFQLHPSFSNPRRVVKVPPYFVSEMGYAGFDLPVEIFFKNKKKPKSVMFTYDLFLPVDKAIKSNRREKLTFQKPAKEFMDKLINAGKVLMLPLVDVCGPPTKAAPLDTKEVLVLPPVDLCAPPNTTQRQSVTSKENVSKQKQDFSEMGKYVNNDKHISAAEKSSENNSNGHDEASNSLSIMASTPPPLVSKKRTSGSSNGNKSKKAKISSSEPCENVRREDRQRSEEKEKKKKGVKRKDCESKDKSHSKYHKKDTSKQKTNKNVKEEKVEYSLKDDKKEAKDDTKEVRDDKKEVRDDKKKVRDDKKEVRDDKKEVRDDKKEVRDDKKEVRDDKKEVRDDKKEVRDDKKKLFEVISPPNNTKRTQSRSVLHLLMDELELEGISSDDDDDIFNADIFCQQLSVGKKNTAVQSSKASPAPSCNMNPPKPAKVISENTSAIKEPTPPKEHREETATKSVSETEVISLLSSTVYNESNSMNTLQMLMQELQYILADNSYDITAAVNIFSQRKSLTKMSANQSQEKSTSSEELIKLAELESTLMGIKDLAVLQKAVKLILSSG
ncbi:hypothetical protein ACJMK2_027680, partial [Sinanodonta woodiana]